MILATTLAIASLAPPSDSHLVYEAKEGPGAGKHIVLVAGDEEYRSEEALPMLARILAERHGFRCTVLFSTDPETGEIDPNEQTHIPGLEALADADMAVLFLRFRELPDEDMKHIVDYLEAGKPVFGIRTSTHAFDYKRDKESPYARYTWRGHPDWPKGFGGHYLGETWVNHHGGHGSQATRGIVEEGQEGHPILRGYEPMWGDTDVYGIRELPDDATVLVRGAVLESTAVDAAPVEGKKNDPMMPLVWTREIEQDGGGVQRTVCSTLGAASDLVEPGSRRVFVNACYWGAGMEDAIPEQSDVELVGPYDPTRFGFKKAKKGVKPSDHALHKLAGAGSGG